jgi:adenylate cyclase
VVAAIEPELYAAEYLRSRRSSPESLDAWECVIRAHSAIGQGTQETAGAERLCRRAIAIAPSYAQAHSLLAWVLLHRSTLSGDLRSVLEEISAEIDTALTLDVRDPWAHLVQSIFHRRSRRFAEAVRSARRALELNPNFALAHAVLAMPLAYQGAYKETIASAQHALRLSPFERGSSQTLSSAGPGRVGPAGGARPPSVRRSQRLWLQRPPAPRSDRHDGRRRVRAAADKTAERQAQQQPRRYCRQQPANHCDR